MDKTTKACYDFFAFSGGGPMPDLCVLLVQHAAALHFTVPDVHEDGVRSNVFRVMGNRGIGCAGLVDHMERAVAIVIFDDSRDTAIMRRELMTFAGSVPPELRHKLILVPIGGYSGEWEPLHLRVAIDDEQLARFIHDLVPHGTAWSEERQEA